MYYVVTEHQRDCIYCSYCLRLQKSDFDWFILSMTVVTSRACSRLRIPQFCQPPVKNIQVNWTEAWQTLLPLFPTSEGRVRMSNLPEVTHTFEEEFIFNQHLPLPPSSTYEDLLGKITVTRSIHKNIALQLFHLQSNWETFSVQWRLINTVPYTLGLHCWCLP